MHSGKDRKLTENQGTTYTGNEDLPHEESISVERLAVEPETVYTNP
jgi:hypothetical protein